MPIVLSRIDSRLIHGQVLAGWIPFTDATMIIVADNIAASNYFQKKIMEVAVPSELILKVKKVEDAVSDLQGNQYKDEKIMIIFSRLNDAVEAVRKGLVVNSINLGNLHYAVGKRQVTPSISLNDSDIANLKTLLESGVHIDVRTVPRDKPAQIEKIISGYHKACGRQI